MSAYTKTNLNIFSFKNKLLQATFYQPKTANMQTVLLYFHGGGFVFGSREDLPTPVIEQLTANGIGMVAVDYPLAPETKFPTLLKMTHKVTKWFVEEFLPANNVQSYFIFGRSAGGFLALANGVYAQQLSTYPKGIISFYGYYHLSDASFSLPNRYYLQYPKVNEQIVANQIQKEPLFESTDQNRYFIYMAARQKGDWMDTLLDSPEQKKKLSLSKDEVKGLPPLFLAASTKDPDVPTRFSRQMANLHPEATLHLVDVEAHDFDRTHVDTLGIEVYEQLTDWIVARLNE